MTLAGATDDEIARYDEVVARLGDATEPALHEQSPGRCSTRGSTLEALDRSADELKAYDELVARSGDATEPALREAVAKARTDSRNVHWTKRAEGGGAGRTPAAAAMRPRMPFPGHDPGR